MTLDQRIAEIAAQNCPAGKHGQNWFGCECYMLTDAIRAALADPVIRQAIENEALEKAAKEMHPMLRSMISRSEAAAAIRRLIK